MINYEDFLLNELVGIGGLDSTQTTEILKKIDDMREQRDSDQAVTGS